MSAHLEVSGNDAAHALCLAMGYSGVLLPVYVDGKPRVAFKASVRAPGKLWEKARALDERRSAEVALGLPEYAASTVLWAWTDTGAQAAAVRRCGLPSPAIVLKMGGAAKRLLLWIIDEPVDHVLVENGNRRLAYALHAPYGRCAPEKLRVPLPGTFLRAGRARPAPVLVTRMELDVVSRARLVAGLKEPPDKDAWRDRARRV